MRTSLTSQQWKRLRAYVNGLTEEQRKSQLHRIEAWTDSAAFELAAIADGKMVAFQSLHPEIVYQVANWLRKA